MNWKEWNEMELSKLDWIFKKKNENEWNVSNENE